jgi:hypothetical protein
LQGCLVHRFPHQYDDSGVSRFGFHRSPKGL